MFLSVTVMLGSGTETETGQRSLKQQMQQSISDHPCNKCCPMRMKTCPATSFGFSCQGQGSVFCETQWLKRMDRSNFNLPVH